MNKKTQIILSLILIFGAGLLLLGKTKNKNTNIQNTNQENSKTSAVISTEPINPADKIEVIHFHATQQCWSCITVGDYALKTIEEKFPEEYESGKITFKDIDGELKENQEIVLKYQARGSSLFINSIVGDKENIKEDVTVWRLVNNEEQFILYFENKLKELLGK